jgi:hypothetical protein
MTCRWWDLIPSSSSRVEIIIDSATLELSASGAVVGKVWLSVDGDEFPEAQWYDLPAAVLQAWLHGFDQLVSSGEGTVKLQFLDGPFHFTLMAAGGETSISLFERDVALSLPVAFDGVSFRGSLLDACREVLRGARERGWVGPEMTGLGQVVAGG